MWTSTRLVWGALFLTACSAPRSSDARTEPSAAPTSRTVLVRVVDGTTGAPAAGARVSYAQRGWATPERIAALWWLFPDDSAWRDAIVSTVLTDSGGTAVLRDPVDPSQVAIDWCGKLLVHANKGGQIGVLDPERPFDHDNEIRLFPDETLSIRVLDVAGQPAGDVPVSIFARYPTDGDAPRTFSAPVWELDGSDPFIEPEEDPIETELWAGRTDRVTGVAVVRGLALLRTHSKGSTLTGAQAIVYGHPKGERRARLELVPGAEAELRLPLASELSIEVVDATGRPVEDSFIHVEFETPTALWPDWSCRSRGPTLRLPNVHPGAPAEVRVRSPGWCTERVEIEASKTAGGLARTRIELSRQPLVVSGRIVDDAGRPLAGRPIEVQVPGRDDTEDYEWTLAQCTDAAGRFVLEIDPRDIAAAADELPFILDEFEVLPTGAWDWSSSPGRDDTLRGTFAFVGRSTSGSCELGDVRVRPVQMSRR